MMISASAVVYRRGWRTKTAMWKKDLLRFSGKQEDTNQWNSPSPRWKRFPNWSWERSGRSGTLLRRKGAKCHQLRQVPTMVSLLHHQRLWKVKSKRDLLATSIAENNPQRSWELSLNPFFCCCSWPSWFSMFPDIHLSWCQIWLVIWLSDPFRNFLFLCCLGFWGIHCQAQQSVPREGSGIALQEQEQVQAEP